MARKVWLWIIAGLALLLALAVTAAIVLGTLYGDAPEPEVPGTSQSPTENQEPAPSEQDTTEGSEEGATQEQTQESTQEQTRESTQEQTQESTQEPTQEQTEQPSQQPTQGQSSQNGGSGDSSDLIYPDPGNENQLPLG